MLVCKCYYLSNLQHWKFPGLVDVLSLDPVDAVKEAEYDLGPFCEKNI